MAVPSPELQAIEIIAPRKFHKIFAVPGTDTRGPLKVTYAIAGVQDGEGIPTILFCGGMFGVRWQAVFLNWLAEKEGVRILFIDRFVYTSSFWLFLCYFISRLPLFFSSGEWCRELLKSLLHVVGPSALSCPLYILGCIKYSGGPKLPVVFRHFDICRQRKPVVDAPDQNI